MGNRPVRRAVVVVAVVAAAGLGIGSGLTLHRASSGPPTTSSSSSAPASGAPSITASAKPKPTPRATPKATPTASTPSASEPVGPAFTELALLQTDDFTERGWETARVLASFPDLPSSPITPCASISADDPGVVKGYGALYASARTRAAEVVGRLDSTRRAKRRFAALREEVTDCATTPAAGARSRTIGSEHTAEASRVSELIWWRTRDPDGDALHGVLGIARADDRVLVLNLESDLSGSDPVDTTEIDSLFIQAARRLV